MDAIPQMRRCGLVAGSSRCQVQNVEAAIDEAIAFDNSFDLCCFTDDLLEIERRYVALEHALRSKLRVREGSLASMFELRN